MEKEKPYQPTEGDLQKAEEMQPDDMKKYNEREKIFTYADKWLFVKDGKVFTKEPLVEKNVARSGPAKMVDVEISVDVALKKIEEKEEYYRKEIEHAETVIYTLKNKRQELIALKEKQKR